MLLKTRKAFTMLELIFVVTIIGILSAIAIPKFAATRDDATITKAKVTVASLRNAMNTERQLRVFRGNFNPISALDGTGNAAGYDQPIFDHFDDNDTTSRVLEYPMQTCKNSTSRYGCWLRTANYYRYYLPLGAYVDFNISNNRFDCQISASSTQANCDLLTR